MNSIRRIPLTIRQIGVRQLETGSNIQPGYDRIRKAQEFFQMADGNLVHEKTRLDRFLFWITVSLTTVGTLGSLQYFYTAAFPKKG